MQQELPTIPGYRVTGRLGQGAFGVVLSAESEADPASRVAIKVMRPGVEVRAKDVLRFRREAKVGRELQHPNILPILELGRSTDGEYIVMDFVEGETLQQRIARRFSGHNRANAEMSARQLEEDLRHFAAICRAVDFAHQYGVIHRDIKPGNILVRSDGHPFLIDFGLARHLRDESTLTSSGVVVGTCFYMAPEQLTGDTKRIGPAIDIYSLGATLHALCTGRVPFTARTYEELRRIVVEQEVPRAPVGVPKGLEAIWLRALEKQPQHRYVSAGAMAEDVERALTGRELSRDGAPLIALRGLRGLHKRRWVLAAATIVVLVIAAVVLWSQSVDAKEVHAQSLLAEGHSRLIRGEFEQARTAFLRLKGLRPHDPEPDLHIAGVEYLIGRKSAAQVHVQSARDLGFQPGSSPSTEPLLDYSTGLYLLANGDEVDAIRFLRSSIEQSDGVVQARMTLALLLWRNGAPDEARAQLDDYIELIAPRNPASLLARVLRYELANEASRALTELDEGLRRHGQFHIYNAHGTRGRLLLRLRCIPEAKAELLEASRLVPDEPANWLCLALCHLDQGDWNSAYAAGSTGVQLDPSSTTGHNLLARIDIDQGRYDEAATHLRNAGAGLSDAQLVSLVEAERDYDHGVELLWTDEHEGGVAALESVLKRTPDHLGALLELAQVRWIEGRHAAALELLVPARDTFSRIRAPVPIGRDMLQLPYLSADNELHLHTMLFANAVLVPDSELAKNAREAVEAEIVTRTSIAADRAFNYAEALWKSKLPEFRDVPRAKQLLDSAIVDWSKPLSPESMKTIEAIRREALD